MNIKKGLINSIQSLGALDGPGIRFVVFMQGCNLRCGCCHNPDTWDMKGGTEYSAEEIVSKAIRYKEYFADEGGITVSGGEPLLQAEFVSELFRLCHLEGINTCLDTSGNILNDNIKELLDYTDRVLLDIKYSNNEDYLKYAGCRLDNVLEFLDYLNKKNIPVTLRQVIIPTLNDNRENILFLKQLAEKYHCIDKTELLPFKKICKVKYDKLKIPFAFESIPEPDVSLMEQLNSLL